MTVSTVQQRWNGGEDADSARSNTGDIVLDFAGSDRVRALLLSVDTTRWINRAFFGKGRCIEAKGLAADEVPL